MRVDVERDRDLALPDPVADLACGDPLAVPEADSSMAQVVRVVVWDASGLAGVPHHLVRRLPRMLDAMQPGEKRRLGRTVLRRAAVDQEFHKPVRDLQPARLPAAAAPFHDLRTGEDATGVEVDVAPGERDVLTEPSAVLLEEDVQESSLPRHVLK